MTRFLLCGAGSIGRRHLRNLQALGCDDFVLYRSGKSTLPESELEGLETESDLRVALDKWKPQAALITNPTAHHLDIAIPAAQDGCHLFIEKPISHSMVGIDDLKHALASAGVTALVGYHFRFNPGLQLVKQLLGDGEIGKVVNVRAYWGEYLPDWHPWEDFHSSYAARAELGGGVVLTLSHPFDYLGWLFGEITVVGAEVSNSGNLGITVEDRAAAVLVAETGEIITLQLDYLARPPAHWLEITGSKGSIHWDGMDGTVRWWNEKWTTESPPPDFERNSMFLDEMRHFLDVVEGKAEPICSLHDGEKALELALKVLKTAGEGVEAGSPIAEVGT